MLEFKIGDKVKIRSFKEIQETLLDNHTSGLLFDPSMEKYTFDARVHTICKKYDDGSPFFRLEEPFSEWWWHAKWLKRAEKITLKEFLND